MKYRKPDGTVTDSSADYVDTWRALGDPVAAAFGCRVIGMDPDFTIGDDDRCFELPKWAAERLLKTLKDVTVKT